MTARKKADEVEKVLRKIVDLCSVDGEIPTHRISEIRRRLQALVRKAWEMGRECQDGMEHPGDNSVDVMEEHGENQFAAKFGFRP